MSSKSRAEDARRREEMAAAARRNESIAAQVLVDEFVADAKGRGLVPEPLRAQLMDGTRAEARSPSRRAADSSPSVAPSPPRRIPAQARLSQPLVGPKV